MLSVKMVVVRGGCDTTGLYDVVRWLVWFVRQE